MGAVIWFTLYRSSRLPFRVLLLRGPILSSRPVPNRRMLVVFAAGRNEWCGPLHLPSPRIGITSQDCPEVFLPVDPGLWLSLGSASSLPLGRFTPNTSRKLEWGLPRFLSLILAPSCLVRQLWSYWKSLAPFPSPFPLLFFHPPLNTP